MTKILVYGAGPLGSLFAARLQQGGNDVSILARGQRLDDLREYGVVLVDVQTQEKSVTRVNIVEALAPKDAYDLVLVNRLQLARFALPDVVVLLELDGATAMERIRRRGRSLPELGGRRQAQELDETPWPDRPGFQPRRQADRLGKWGSNGEGVGCGHRPGGPARIATGRLRGGPDAETRTDHGNNGAGWRLSITVTARNGVCSIRNLSKDKFGQFLAY